PPRRRNAAGNPQRRPQEARCARCQNLYAASTPIVRGGLVAIRLMIEMFADSAPVSLSRAFLFVRLSTNSDADQLLSSTPSRKPARSYDGSVLRVKVMSSIEPK